jgi:hypothetical protein
MNTAQPFTRQELGDLVSGARAPAYQASEECGAAGQSRARESFLQTERAYREPAAKCERLAWDPASASPDAPLELPVHRQK